MAIELPDGRSESNDVLDALRLRAVQARELGYAVVDIAAILGVREETVSRWCSRYDHGGQEALPGDRTGRPIGSGRLLTGEQERRIQEAIETRSPQELEIPSALWTRQAVQELIKQQVGIRIADPDRGRVSEALGLHAPEARAEGVQARSRGGGRMAGKEVSGDREAGVEGGWGDPLGG